MRIIFVRHGHPDYKNDCLTELGHRHAEEAAERLKEEPIVEIHASSCGRATETAEHIAARHELEVIQHDFMREVRWGSLNEEPIEHRGHPWYTAEDMLAAGQSLLEPDWAEREPFCKNKVCAAVKQVAEDFDCWLETFGYRREGAYYRVVNANSDTIAMVSHGGSSSAVFAHLLNLTFPYICAVIQPDFTAITVFELDGEEGSLITPKVELMNDARHITGIESERQYQ